MTCVVGVAQGGRVLLAGDSAATDDEDFSQVIITNPAKVTKIRGRVFGFSGLWKVCRILRNLQLSEGRDDPEDDVSEIVEQIEQAWKGLGGGDFETDLLIGVRNRLFVLQDDWSWIEPAPVQRKNKRKHDSLSFYAIGSGGSVAFGALAAAAGSELTMLQRAEEALTISSTYCANVRPPFVHVVT